MKRVLTVACMFIFSFFNELGSSAAHASIVIHGTRVIYDGNKKEVTIPLTNNNKTPVLIQNWIDTGNEQAEPGNETVPFVITPPINRVDPGKGQTLRITYTGNPALPANKESVFWLNVLEIPAKNKMVDDEQSMLNIAFRSRIKLFYRPAGLQGEPLLAPESLTWKTEGAGVRVTNPTPWHVSFVSISLKNAANKKIETPGKMIGPGESQLYTFSGVNTGIDLKNVSFSVINDYGALTEYKAEK